MFIANSASFSMMKSAYANNISNIQHSTKKDASGSGSNTTEQAGAKSNQTKEVRISSTARTLSNPANPDYPFQIDNSSNNKINDQLSMTNSNDTGELNLYTATAKLNSSESSQSKNSTDANSSNKTESVPSAETETDTTNSSAVDIVAKTEEIINTISKVREDLTAQKSSSSVGMDNSRRALFAYGENIANAETKIRDIDFASETTFFTKNQGLISSSTTMLSQSFQINSHALNLIG